MAIIDIKTDVTGVVLRIDTQMGQTIEEDDAVITVESMKMHIPVPAPQDGKVIEILVAEGEVISEGQVVAKFEA